MFGFSSIPSAYGDYLLCGRYFAVAVRDSFGELRKSNILDHLERAGRRDHAPPASPRVVNPAVPKDLQTICVKCLAKEREARFQSASDLAFALRSSVQGSGVPAAAERPAPASRRGPLLGLGLGLAAGLAVGYTLRPVTEVPEPIVLALTPGVSREASPAISPDGKFVAYLASEGGRTDVWVKFVGGGNGAVGVNAFTTQDQTQYIASVPSDMLEQWFSIISEQLFEPSWREFYVEKEVVQREWTREPIARLRTYLYSKGLWSKEEETSLVKQCAEEVESAVAAYLSTPAPTSDAMFDYLYEEAPQSLQAQRAIARRFAPK